MSTKNRVWLWAVAALLAAPLAASAQDNVFRGGNSISSVPTNPQPFYNPGFQSVPYTPGYYPPVLYGAGYGNSYSASLHGLADLATAQGQYLNDWQRARITNQSVEQEKLRTRKMALELKAYEQSLIVPLEDIREQERQRELRRALGDPPATEIYSATALNNILKDIQDMHARKIQGPSVTVDPDILGRINLAVPSGGNVGVFKNGARPKWPQALLDNGFEEQRKAVEDAMAVVARQGESGAGIDGATVKQYLDAVGALEAKIDAEARNMSISNIMQAKRQLTELNDAGTAIQSADATNLFSKRWKVQGSTVGDVVTYMGKEGLKFGPATKGDESAYRAFHYALVSYNLGTRQAALSQK